MYQVQQRHHLLAVLSLSLFSLPYALHFNSHFVAPFIDYISNVNANDNHYHL